jgi:probable rRNA maturation factor
MLHLFGYDHIEDEERRKMEDLQEKILTMKGYTRDYEEK